LAVREFEAGQEKNFCKFLLHNPLQGVEKTCTFSLPFESDKAKAKQLTNRRLTPAVAGTLTVEESKEKADRPYQRTSVLG
jgi:hypothetical protein